MMKNTIDYINTRIDELDGHLKADKMSVPLHRVLVDELTGVLSLLQNQQGAGE